MAHEYLSVKAIIFGTNNEFVRMSGVMIMEADGPIAEIFGLPMTI